MHRESHHRDPVAAPVSAGWARQLLYAPVLTLAMATMMVRLLVLASILSVHEFSRLGVGLLVSNTFYMLGCLGLQQLLQRQWPVNIVRGQELPGMVLAVQCSLVALGCAALGLAPAAIGVPLAGASPAIWAVGVLHGFSQQAFIIATVESRSRGDATRYAWQNMARSSVAIVLGVAAAVYTTSAFWVLAVETAAAALQSWLMFRRSAVRAAVRLSGVFAQAIRRFREIDWKAAATMLVVGSLAFLTINADRWLAAGRLGAGDFGIYSFAWILLLVAQSMQALMNASLYPLLARTHGSRGRREAFAICLKSSTAMLVIGCVAALPSWWLLDWAVGRWFAPYQAAAGLFPLFLVIAVLRVSDFWTSYLLVVGKERQLLALNVAAAMASLVLWSVLVRPWGAVLQMQQIALLGVAFAVLGYGVVVGMAWRERVD
jgi:O-antigen/teichoic acid export membrane protein